LKQNLLNDHFLLLQRRELDDVGTYLKKVCSSSRGKQKDKINIVFSASNDGEKGNEFFSFSLMTTGKTGSA
jgi:hypothetical protein